MKRNKFIQTGKIIVMALLIGNSGMAQTVNQFSAQQAVDYGLKNSNQVKNALLDVLIQEQSNKDLTSAALPHINVSGTITDYLDIPVTLIPASLFDTTAPANKYTPFKFGTKWNSGATVSFSQVLFDGQVFAGLAARKVIVSQKQRAAEITEINIKANIYKIYYQLVASKTQIDLLDANIERLNKLSHDTKEIYKNGFAEKIDVDRLSVQIANLQTEELTTKNSILNGYTGLKILMGMPVKDSLVLTDTLNDDQIKQGVLESSNYNYSDRKEYQLLQLANQLNQLSVKRYNRSQIPTLYFNGVYGKQAYSADNDFDIFDANNSWYTTSYIGLQLSIPIFNGFSTRAKIQESKLQLRQSQNQLEDIKLSIDNDVAVARNNFATAIATMDFQKQNMQLAETVYDQTKKKYETGTGSLTDINNSDTDLKTAQANYISALYDAIIAKIDFLKAVGKL
ncbi:MAG TPA: TolC family protein [Ferruginibacter sp.]|jgi:outer membrane protein|nr:TolC family protein [Ferruginibacter sp.]